MKAGPVAAVAAAGVVGAALAVDGPSLLTIPAVRRRFHPGVDGRGSSDHVALTFDDGPDPRSTPAFLDALARQGWHATFFMLGFMVVRAPGLAAEVAAAGHEIALHGYDHRSHLIRTPAAVLDDLRRGYDTVAEASGRTPAYLRPPMGHVATSTLVGARRLGAPVVLWGAWGRDWRRAATPGSVAAEVDRRVSGGDTVLLHDSDSTSTPGCWTSALGALPLLAERLGARGLEVGPLREHGAVGAAAARARP